MATHSVTLGFHSEPCRLPWWPCTCVTRNWGPHSQTRVCEPGLTSPPGRRRGQGWSCGPNPAIRTVQGKRCPGVCPPWGCLWATTDVRGTGSGDLAGPKSQSPCVSVAPAMGLYLPQLVGHTQREPGIAGETSGTCEVVPGAGCCIWPRQGPGERGWAGAGLLGPVRGPSGGPVRRWQGAPPAMLPELGLGPEAYQGQGCRLVLQPPARVGPSCALGTTGKAQPSRSPVRGQRGSQQVRAVRLQGGNADAPKVRLRGKPKPRVRRW